jgi:putative DNA primase/helicase
MKVDVSSLEDDFEAISAASPNHKPPGAVDIAGRMVGAKELAGLSGLPVGKQGPIVKAPYVADVILESAERFVIDTGGRLYVYRRGVYVPGERAVERWTDTILDDQNRMDKWTTRLVKEVIAYLAQNKAALLPIMPDPGVINLQNGLYEIASGTLLEHRPDFLSMVQFPVNFDPDAECPAWDQQIEETLPSGRDARRRV